MDAQRRRHGPGRAAAAAALVLCAAAVQADVPASAVGRAPGCSGAPAAPAPRPTVTSAFDRRGRLLRRTVDLRVGAGPTAVQARLQVHYDLHGRVVALTLPDGSALLTGRDARGRPVSLRRRPAPVPGTAPDQVLVRHVQHAGASARLTYGDGQRGVPAPGAWPAADDAAHRLVDLDGRRLADLDARGRLTRLYLWLDDTPVAQVDFVQPRVPEAPPASLPERIGRLLATAWRLLAGGGERLRYLPRVLAADGPAARAPDAEPEPMPRPPPHPFVDDVPPAFMDRPLARPPARRRQTSRGRGRRRHTTSAVAAPSIETMAPLT